MMRLQEPITRRMPLVGLDVSAVIPLDYKDASPTSCIFLYTQSGRACIARQVRRRKHL